MAEGETATCDASFQEEPTLSQLRDILVNLESSEAAILQDNANLREELSQFRATFQSHGRDIVQLKTKLAKVIKENQTLRTELDQTRKKLKDEQDDTSRMWVELDELEQYSRKSSLEIYGIPESAYVSTDEAVLKLARALDVEIASTDIDISRKIKRKGKTCIIAKFISHKTKTNVYKKRTKLKNIGLKDIFPSFSNTTSAAESSPIFINESLTAYRQGLVARAAKMRQDSAIHSFWTIDGKVFVKTSPEGSPTRIVDGNGFNNL